MKKTFLDSVQLLLGRYFEIGVEERDENGNIIIEGTFHEVPSEPKKPSSLQKKYTKAIIDGDLSILQKFLKQYSHNHSKKEGLLFLFQNNLELSHWLVEEAPDEIVIQLPLDIWEMVDKQLAEKDK